MKGITRLNLHCHSNLSDGILSPERVAELLLGAGVEYAALTDHDTTEGYESFRRVLTHHGVGVISGVEITTFLEGIELHVLGYNFNVAYRPLQQVLAALRQQNDTSMQGLVGSIRRMGSRRNSDPRNSDKLPLEQGKLGTEDAIALIHDAGGKAFLAHPMINMHTLEELEPIVARLAALGLDGIEAIYSSFSETTRHSLLELARKYNLFVSAGTDFHDPGSPTSDISTEMPTSLWKEFRNSLQSVPPSLVSSKTQLHQSHGLHGWKWSYALRFVFPSLIALALFTLAVFAIIIPGIEERLLDRKREMIRELTNSAWSILEEYHKETSAGQITVEQAQTLAKSRIQFLRYGKEGKDYFWITDMHPRMIMHPYRSDLNGKDVSQFVDARGARIFVEFAELVRRRQEGYVEYYWQWKDDPQRVVPKESYIKLFRPWGWVIGTGIYIEDVQQEISRISRTLINTLLGITATLGLLLAFLAQQSFKIERRRFRAEEALRDWNERYRSLVEASTEGTAMILAGRCSYANRTLLDMLGYSDTEFNLLRLEDILPEASALERIGPEESNESSEPFEATLRTKDGDALDCIVTANRMSFAGQDAVILVAKDLHRHAKMVELADPAFRKFGRPSDNIPIGILRLQAGRGGKIIDANTTARQMLGLSATETLSTRTFSEFVEDGTPFSEFLHNVKTETKTSEQVVKLRSGSGFAPTVSVSAVSVCDESGVPRFYDLAMVDITEQERNEAETQLLVDRLQTSLHFLQEPIATCAVEAPTCEMYTQIEVAVSNMSRRNATAIFVTSESGEVVGIVTDHDLRSRVIGAGLGFNLPVYRIMSSPLVSIDGKALVYEALMLMEENGIQHVAVTDESGIPRSIVRAKELLQFRHYGVAVITREIQHAKTLEEIIAARERLPMLVRGLLNSGTRSRNITRVITSVSDAVTEKLIRLAVQELGEPPARFVFVALGSQGRDEQTLATDQDNGIIYEDLDSPDAEKTQEYFLALAAKTCDWLHQAGFRFCPGKIMAKNPKWCQPLAHWKEYFSDWITTAEPQELLEFNTFFDLRPVYGDPRLANELRAAVQQSMSENPSFFLHLAQNALLYKPPQLGLIGKLVSAGTGEDANRLNIKDVMLSVVNFARLYALREGVAFTNTNERLDALGKRKALTVSSHEEITTAYDYLMQLRLNHQAAAIADNLPPDNIIDLRKLTHLEESMLKHMFGQISSIQKKISYDFLGGMQ